MGQRDTWYSEKDIPERLDLVETKELNMTESLKYLFDGDQ